MQPSWTVRSKGVEQRRARGEATDFRQTFSRDAARRRACMTVLESAGDEGGADDDPGLSRSDREGVTRLGGISPQPTGTQCARHRRAVPGGQDGAMTRESTEQKKRNEVLDG